MTRNIPETLIYSGLHNTFSSATMFKLKHNEKDVYLLVNKKAPTQTSTVNAAETIYEQLKARRGGDANFRLLHLFDDGTLNVAESIHDGEAKSVVVGAPMQSFNAPESTGVPCTTPFEQEVVQTPTVSWLHFTNVYNLLQLEQNSLPIADATACV